MGAETNGSDAAPRFEMRVQITLEEKATALVYACEGHRPFERQFRVRVVSVPTEVVLRDGAATCPGRPAGVSICSVSACFPWRVADGNA
jgi:hypothetical protein